MTLTRYFKKDFMSDLKAGLITGVVAIPLAIAFAIASGVSPVLGFYTAIIAGILTPLLGGSSYSISGPTGAMAVIILSIVNQYGIEGLLLAGFVSGLLQLFFGFMNLGKVIKYIPLPVVSGFTAGIGAVIFIGQLPNLFGITIAQSDKVWINLYAIFSNIFLINKIAFLIAIVTIIMLIYLPRLISKIKFLKDIPPSFIALCLSIIFVYFLKLNVPIIGDIPKGLPAISMFNLSWTLLISILPAAFTIAILGSIESLLCAVVCDTMTCTKHNSNKELIGQGLTNMILPFFGTLPSTAAIARSAVNIREGAKTKFSGVIHALFILGVLLFLSPLIKYIPKAFLAGVLIVVSIKMINFHEFKTMWKLSKEDILIFLVTFTLTIFTDLVFAVQIGMLFAVFLLFLRLVQLTEIKSMDEYHKDTCFNNQIQNDLKLKDNVAIFTIYGPLFFGTMDTFENRIYHPIYIKRKYVILRMNVVNIIDSTAIERLKSFILDRQKGDDFVYLTELRPNIKNTLLKDDEFKKMHTDKIIFETTNDALNYIRQNIK